MEPLSAVFAQWEQRRPQDLIGDPIWRLPAYRTGLFMSEVSRLDAAKLPPSAGKMAEQLIESIDSISVNISEGYGRASGRERARFYEIALASAREARDWYRRSSLRLPVDARDERLLLLTRVIKILTVAIPQERAGASERRMQAPRRTTLPSGETPPSDGATNAERDHRE